MNQHKIKLFNVPKHYFCSNVDPKSPVSCDFLLLMHAIKWIDLRILDHSTTQSHASE